MDGGLHALQQVPTFGAMPMAKFGHCCCLITPTKLIIFGGASGNVNNFSITNDTFCLEMTSDPVMFTWRKLDSSRRNQPRHWHSALPEGCISGNQL